MDKKWVYIICLALIIAVIIYSYKLSIEVPQPQAEVLPFEIMPQISVGELPIAELNPDTTNFTALDILRRSSDEGLAFCDKLAQEYLKPGCVQNYLISKAVNDRSPGVCLQSKDPAFVEPCKTIVTILIVAVTYHNEAQLKNDPTIVPSNIALCDNVKTDKDLCINPKRTIERNYNNVLGLIS